MSVVLGYVGIIFCVIMGLIGPGGNPAILMQPYELLVIGGSGVFITIINTPFRILKGLPKRLLMAVKGSGVTKAKYYELLGLLGTVFTIMRKDGVLGIENDLSNPHESALFNQFPLITHDHHLLDSICGALRLMVDGVVTNYDLERLLDSELEAHHEEWHVYPTVLTKLADSLPALGIVACVLGIVITMSHLDGPPEQIGAHVAAALIGTMLGILLAYGFVAPIVGKMEHVMREEAEIFGAFKSGIVSFSGGAAPQVALEFASKTIPSELRPTPAELEEILKKARGNK